MAVCSSGGRFPCPNEGGCVFYINYLLRPFPYGLLLRVFREASPKVQTMLHLRL
jgi:hypothetical protein